MNILQILQKFFQFLSKTDQDVLRNKCCTRSARMTQTSLGVMVFFTGILAFFSGSYAIYTTFSNSFLAPLLAPVLGIIYGCMIIVFDREIVSATDKRAVLIRFPLAIAIGFIVAVPLELRLLEDSIQEELGRMTRTENSSAVERRDRAQDEFEARKKAIEQEITKYKNEVSKWDGIMEAEAVGRQIAGRTGIAGRGPAYEEALRNKDKNQEFLNDAQSRLSKLEGSEDQFISKIDTQYKDRYHGKATDFLSRYVALESLKSNSTAAWWISWGLRLFFILVEVFPAFVKMFLPYNEYNAIAEARRRTTIQMIHATGNQMMSDTAQNPPIPPQRGFLDLLNNQP